MEHLYRRMLRARPGYVQFMSIVGTTTVTAHWAWQKQNNDKDGVARNGESLSPISLFNSVRFPYLQSFYLTYLRQSELSVRNALLGSAVLSGSPRCEALMREEDKSFLQKINTNVYVWGEGFQVDPTQDYSNFTPKKIQQFKGNDKPNIVDVAFGWYHEAFIDSKGKLFVCAKAKLPSIEVEGLRDGDRQDVVEVKNLPRGTKVRQVSFTQSRMFVLTERGEVFIYVVQEHLPNREDMMLYAKNNPASQIRGELMVFDAPKKVKDIGFIKQIASGLDHVVFLNKKGELMAMGDDTFGQCGSGGEGRTVTAPFNEARIRMPVKCTVPKDSKGSAQPVKKIVCGFRHTLAITENGKLYGWGYNNQQQLSHSQEFADESNPQHAIIVPTRIMGPLTEMFVVDAAAGEEFSMFVAQGKKSGKVFEQVFACGNNLKGSLGINRTSHVQDLTIVPDLSDIFDESDQGRFVNHIQCGRRHCVATFDFGGFLYWGDNHVGQLGNRRRSFLESPYPSKKFEQRHNVENVIVGLDSCSVIVEDSGKLKKKKSKKKKAKRILKREELVTSEDELKRRTEAQIVKETDEDKDGRGRKSVIDRVRSRFLEGIYGKQADKSKEVASKEVPNSKNRELDRLIEEERKQKAVDKKE